MTDFDSQFRARLLGEDVLRYVKDGQLIYVNGATGFPNRFMQQMAAAATGLHDVRLFHPMRRETATLDPDPTSPDLAGHIFHVSDFTYDASVRKAIHEGRASYRPTHSSDGGRRFPHAIDLLVAAAAPMDRHGYFNLGAFGGWISDFIPRARKLVLEVNPKQPHVFGENYVHVSRVDGVIEADYDIVELPQSSGAPSEIEQRIAANVVSLVEDGATLQVGAGGLPEAIVNQLAASGIKDLGVHTESFFDWVVTLTEAGIITNSRKNLDVGRMVAAMAIGSRRLYDFVDRNPGAQIRPFSYVNEPRIIARGHKPVSINATLQIDLQGQCASEGFGSSHHGGIGGQWNFHYGSGLADGGKGIIALPSTAKQGTVSRIVPTLAAGTAVSITRNDIHYVVTEWGIADLRGKPLDERAKLLISIAHPSFRESLERAARDELHVIGDVLQAGV